MPTYVTLVKWTDQGIRAVKESPKRLDAVREAARRQGGQLKDFYLVMGEYDLVVVFDFPADEPYTSTVLAIASQGNVRTTSLRAYSEDEYRRIIAAIP